MVLAIIGCHSDPFRDPRVISEEPRKEVVIAVPENSGRFPARAEALARKRLHDKKVVLVSGKERETTDLEGKGVERTGFIMGSRSKTKEVHRRQYEMTFRPSRTSGD